MRKWIFMAAALIATLAAVSCEKEKMGDRLLGSWALDHRSVNGISDMPEGEVTVTFYNDGTMTWNSTLYTWMVKGKKLTLTPVPTKMLDPNPLAITIDHIVQEGKDTFLSWHYSDYGDNFREEYHFIGIVDLPK